MKYLSLLFLALIACSGRHHHDEQSWKQFDDLHRVMAKAYHPLADSGTVMPAKKLSDDLAKAVDALAEGSLPRKVDNNEMKERIEKLKSAAHNLVDDVRSGASDEVIKAKVTSLHDLFHKIMEAWSGDEHNEKSDAHHEHDDDDEDDD